MNLKIGKRIGRRGRVLLAVAAILIATTMVSASLLTYYGSISTTVDVKASVQIKTVGEGWHNWDVPIDTFKITEEHPGGESFCFKFWVKNWASVEAPIWFESSDYPDNGITANVYAFPTELTTLQLTSKGSDWQPDGRMKATLTFNPVSLTFDYDLTAEGLEKDTKYNLIYYADKHPRFQYWGGDNPGALIGTFTAGADGTVSLVGQTVELNMNLPSRLDWNIHPSPNYCDYNNGFDDFEHGEGGAKIWIVPSDCYDEDACKVTTWLPSRFLFETDLISYSDCNFKVVPWTMILWTGDPITSAIIPSGDEVPFFVCYAFKLNGYPGEYTIKTWVNTEPPVL